MAELETASSPMEILRGCNTIALSQGLNTLVDAADYGVLSRFKWCARVNKCGRRITRYASRRSGKSYIGMHHFILSPSGGFRADHKSCDSLDNTRGNLRAASHAQNMQNRRPALGRTFKGVTRESPRRNAWRAQIKVGGKNHRIGCFSSPEEAARAYDAAALKHFGEFSRLNFPTEAAASA